MNDRLEYLIQLQEANAFSRGVAENVTAYYAIQAIEKARNNMPD